MKTNIPPDILITSFHSEVNDEFVSNPYPHLNEQIQIKFRCITDSSIKKIFLRSIIDGTSVMIPMQLDTKCDGFNWYSAFFIMTQATIHYHFIIITDKKVYYFNRLETTLYPPTEDYDFVILSDFNNPDWVYTGVFYQIFPDRFKQGTKFIGVTDSEYEFDSHATIQNDWSEPPPPYSTGHCLDFYGGDLYGIIDSIPYFKELGITSLYLNPIFSAKTHHRYDCIDYFTVDSHLGGNEALQELTQTLHKNGMRIILDVSINHTGIDHIWAQKAIHDPDCEERNFYYYSHGKLALWMGVDTLPQLNYNSNLLRNIIYRSENSFIRKFLKPPFKIDGYRFDVGNNTARNKKDQFGNEVFKEVRNAIKSENSKAYIIGEHWKDYISYVLGDQWDGSMNYYGSSRPARSFAGENDRYLRHIIGDSKEYFTSGGNELAALITRHLFRIPNQLMFLQFNLLDSHDIHRFHNHLEIFTFEIYRGILIYLYLLPGTFSIYYGDEIGIAGKIDTMENTRYPMEWNRSKWNTSFFELYKKLNHIKKNNKALHTGSFSILYADEETIVLARFYKQNIVIGITNKSVSTKRINFSLIQTGIMNINTTFYEQFSNTVLASNSGYLEVTLNSNQSLLLIN